MERQKFLDMLDQLHNELEVTHSIDDKSRELLRSVMNDIQQLLEQSSEDSLSQRNTAIGQLTNTIHHFENSHPTLVSIIRNLIDTLSNIGI